MSSSKKLLMISGLGLALWGMAFGLYYAVFAEHQALDRIGSSLAMSFAEAASGRMSESASSLNEYADAQYSYVRYVDVHSHWIGLAMLLLLFGLVNDRIAATERGRLAVAISLVLGSMIFPLGVLLQAISRGPLGKGVAAAGAALVTLGLVVTAFGFWRAKSRA